MEPSHTQGVPPWARCPNRTSLRRENRAGLLAKFRFRSMRIHEDLLSATTAEPVRRCPTGPGREPGPIRQLTGY